MKTQAPLRRVWLIWMSVIAMQCMLPLVMHLTFLIINQYRAMEDKSTLLARHAEQIIGQRPSTWEFEEHRLSYLLSFAGTHPYEGVHIANAAGTVISEHGKPGPAPRLRTEIPLRDGADAVGFLVIQRSMLSFVPQLGATVVISLLLAAIVYMGAVSVPLRTVTALTNRLRSERDTEVLRRHEVEEQLQRARKLEAIATMASGMAHFLNNMLTPITLFGDALRTKFPDGTREREMLEHICEGAGRASALVSSVLAFGRTQKLKVETVRVQVLLASVVGLIRHQLPAGITLDIAPEGHDGWLNIDIAQTEAALHNILKNSVDAMRDGGGTLSITVTAQTIAESAEQLALPGEYWVIRIADNGPGMPPEVAERAFEPFFTTKAIGKGSGLGLYTTHETVRGQGGVMTLETHQGEGTTVTICLPVGSPPQD